MALGEPQGPVERGLCRQLYCIKQPDQTGVEHPGSPYSACGGRHMIAEINGIALHYETSGDGQPLLWLHGFMATRNTINPATVIQNVIVVPDSARARNTT